MKCGLAVSLASFLFITVAGAQGKSPPKVSLNVRAADLSQVTKTLAQQAKVKINLARDARGKVTITVRNIELEDLLDVILPPLQLEWRKDKNGYTIVRAEKPSAGVPAAKPEAKPPQTPTQPAPPVVVKKIAPRPAKTKPLPAKPKSSPAADTAKAAPTQAKQMPPPKPKVAKAMTKKTTAARPATKAQKVAALPSVSPSAKALARPPEPAIDEGSRGFYPNGLKGEYFEDPDHPVDVQQLLGKPPPGPVFNRHVFTRTDPQINFRWDTPKSPAEGIGLQYWSARWTGTFWVEKTDSYTFFLENLDDAAQLFIDGKLILESWKIQPATTYKSEPVKLERGRHEIKVEYHQGLGPGGSIRLSWQSPTMKKQVMVFPKGLKAEYFEDPDAPNFPGLNVPPPGPCFTAKIVERTESRIDFNWGPTPHPDINDQYWSVRWTGKLIVPETDDYVFFLDNLDDAGRLTIDDKLIIDAWLIQAPASHQGQPIRLTKGVHNIKLEYHQGAPPAGAIVLAWQSGKFAKEVIQTCQAVPKVSSQQLAISNQQSAISRQRLAAGNKLKADR